MTSLARIHGRAVFFLVLFASASLMLFLTGGHQAAFASEASARDVLVRHVIDGDTVELKGGELVRYVGVDTPEAGEPFYRAAQKRNRALVEKKTVKLVVCTEEPLDKYGRTLGWVYVGDVSVNEVLLSEGLARTLSIPPCGVRHMERYKTIASSAKHKKIGLWGVPGRARSRRR